MAIIKLNSQNGHLYVRAEVGLLEEFKPDKELELIQKRVHLLELKAKKAKKDLFGDMSAKDAIEKMKENQVLKEGWVAFMSEVYAPELEQIKNLIINKNKKICKGYSDYLKAKESS